MIYDAFLDALLQKVWDGQRINQAEALRLYHLPLEELGALADAAKRAAERASASIDSALEFIAASNKRIAALEAAAKRSPRPVRDLPPGARHRAKY